MQHPWSFRATCCLCVLVASSARSSAQSTDPAAAEILFREARELVNEGKLTEACPKFIESQRLDPATGTLLAVASCHEEQGLLATAWAEFTQVMGRAEKEGRADRAELARERAEALEPRLSTLTLGAAPELLGIHGLRVRRDGLDVSSMILNRALPIDGGRHDVELEAAGYLPERLSIDVAREGDHVSLPLPVLRLEPAQSSPASVPVAAPEDPAPNDAAREQGLTGTQGAGIAVGAAGVGALAAGGAFFIAALVKLDESGEYCSPDGACDASKGVQLRADAVRWGNVATALGIGGAVLAAAGVTLHWVGKRDASDPTALRRGSLQLVAAPGGAAARLEVGF